MLTYALKKLKATKSFLFKLNYFPLKQIFFKTNKNKKYDENMVKVEFKPRTSKPSAC